jgi:excisionase family DNA binding protein
MKEVTMVEREWYRPEEAGEALGLGKSTIYRLIADGTIPSIRINKTIRVPVAGLRAWAASMVEATTAPSIPASHDRDDTPSAGR